MDDDFQVCGSDCNGLGPTAARMVMDVGSMIGVDIRQGDMTREEASEALGILKALLDDDRRAVHDTPDAVDAIATQRRILREEREGG